MGLLRVSKALRLQLLTRFSPNLRNFEVMHYAGRKEAKPKTLSQLQLGLLAPDIKNLTFHDTLQIILGIERGRNWVIIAITQNN